MALSALRQSLVTQLADGQFHSGTALAEQVGVSRAAINNHITALTDLGLVIHRVKGKGYRIPNGLSLLDPARLVQGRETPIHLFWQIDSTNAFLMGRRGQCVKGEACLAEMQSAGRGRRGRVWFSPLASHLYLSYYWRLEQGMMAASGLSLMVGVVVAEAIASLGLGQVELKWPNDLYLDGRKLGGILVEMSGQMGEPCELVIGCGLNVVMPEGTELDQPWADLQSQQADRIDRNALAQAVLGHLDSALPRFEQEGLAPFVEAWKQRDCFAGKPVQLSMGERVITGVARGIDTQGNLLLALENGELKAFAGGEVSLRLR
ncbi:bifunctional biotin--[acetyl-CoA-carboxylase] ligase/biotin operon repressor BirA [Ferrimonas marina]|uniref:Bifunctional ligase/repressor BirA n=1 Tax=Ferrimonas marina TaxID=299255 RepID=A0A1M5ZQK5_9GAMM|nr:bifunctional biotin--[acetyl-CoA-carboxylase] ligase/biotin operon repressor BirA [Ferrimonas marina]SHI26482.1 BirA family transcriptional regulator, biotin operon repressor / biotin-[acetyl-CoA-carboxylase] ligase [Ferrimonas marina]